MLDITDKESLKALSDTLRKAQEFTGPAEAGDEKQEIGIPPDQDKDKEKQNVVVKSVNLQISLKKIEGALEMLAATTRERNFGDAMEVIWFSFDPKRDHETFDDMSMLTTLMRATLDGNVKPPVDLDELYQECRQKLGLEQGREQKTGVNLSPSPGGRRH